MSKSKAFRAAIARRRAARVKVKHTHKSVLKPNKNREKIHISLTYCPIPKGSIKDNPWVKTEEVDGKKVHFLGWNLDALASYRDIKAKWQKWNKRFYPDVVKYKHGHIIYHTKRRHPWYMITKGKQIAYHSMKENWGEYSHWIRVKSESGVFHDRTIITNMTHDKYKELLIDAKLKDWEKKHQRPIPRDDKQKDLFEAQFMIPWIDEHTKAREKIVEFVNNIGNRVKVFARYKNDVEGYMHKVAELKSDGSKFMILDGKYANYDSQVINKVQNLANKIYKTNKKLIALKVVDKTQECILIPNKRAA